MIGSFMASLINGSIDTLIGKLIRWFPDLTYLQYILVTNRSVQVLIDYDINSWLIHRLTDRGNAKKKKKTLAIRGFDRISVRCILNSRRIHSEIFRETSMIGPEWNDWTKHNDKKKRLPVNRLCLSAIYVWPRRYVPWSTFLWMLRPK